jgi:divalent metal cation (Fe/Co/Zn/Cd) transporter
MHSRICGAEQPAAVPLGITRCSALSLINVIVVRYESSAGRRLRSEVLGADAKHTKSDVWTTTRCWWRWQACGLAIRFLDPSRV